MNLIQLMATQTAIAQVLLQLDEMDEETHKRGVACLDVTEKALAKMEKEAEGISTVEALISAMEAVTEEILVLMAKEEAR